MAEINNQSHLIDDVNINKSITSDDSGTLDSQNISSSSMSTNIHLLKPFLDKYFNDVSVFYQAAHTHQRLLQAEDIDLADAAHSITQDTYSNLIAQCSSVDELLQLLTIKEEHLPFLQDFAVSDVLYWWIEKFYYPSIFVEGGSFPRVFGSTEPDRPSGEQMYKVPFTNTYRGVTFPTLSGYWMGDMKLGDVKKRLNMNIPGI